MSRYFAGPWTMIIGGRLATYPKRSLGVGDYWFVNAHPTGYVTLRASRLDRAVAPLEFSASGYPMARAGLPGEWDRGWRYRTSVSAVDDFPIAAGCWRVQLVNGDPADAIVFESRGPPLPRQG